MTLIIIDIDIEIDNNIDNDNEIYIYFFKSIISLITVYICLPTHSNITEDKCCATFFY